MALQSVKLDVRGNIARVWELRYEQRNSPGGVWAQFQMLYQTQSRAVETMTLLQADGEARIIGVFPKNLFLGD